MPPKLPMAPTLIPAFFIDRHNYYPDLVENLRQAFADDQVDIPDRLHYTFGSKPDNRDATLLVMPAWQHGKDVGIKLVTINPGNGSLGLPAVQGNYLLLDAETGQTRAIIDGKALTRKRTAATSALASSYLSNPQSSTLLMVGTGALAPELIIAHAGVRPVGRVLIWGRDWEKSRELADTIDLPGISIEPIRNIRAYIKDADIISTATLSADPLIFGADLRPGQHLDLVGSYKPDMRESDDEAVRRSSVFVDTYAGAAHESGDIAIPLKKGIIEQKDICAQLSEMCSGQHLGRQSNESITLFKSVGYALEDLVAARYFYGLAERQVP